MTFDNQAGYFICGRTASLYYLKLVCRTFSLECASECAIRKKNDHLPAKRGREGRKTSLKIETVNLFSGMPKPYPMIDQRKPYLEAGRIKSDL
jgi:hypothetical protein